jgi:hypothetical protein
MPGRLARKRVERGGRIPRREVQALGRVYAGILGPLALTAVLLRGLLHGDGAEAVLLAAALALPVFAAIGYAAGGLAEWIVEQSVRGQFAAQLAPPSGDGGERG